jgi:hypothetical protein
MRMYLVPKPNLFEALGAARAFCVVVVILSFETRTVQFHGVPVWACLDVAVCSYVGVIVGVVAANVEVVECFETHARRSRKIWLSLSERKWELEGNSWGNQWGVVATRASLRWRGLCDSFCSFCIYSSYLSFNLNTFYSLLAHQRYESYFLLSQARVLKHRGCILRALLYGPHDNQRSRGLEAYQIPDREK